MPTIPKWHGLYLWIKWVGEGNEKLIELEGETVAELAESIRKTIERHAPFEEAFVMRQMGRADRILESAQAALAGVVLIEKALGFHKEE